MKIFPVLRVFISFKNLSFICYARLCAGYFYIKSSPKENFPIKQKKTSEEVFLHKSGQGSYSSHVHRAVSLWIYGSFVHCKYDVYSDRLFRISRLLAIIHSLFFIISCITLHSCRSYAANNLLHTSAHSWNISFSCILLTLSSPSLVEQKRIHHPD